MWELAHWTLFDAIALVLAWRGTRTSTGKERRIRMGIAVAAGCWLAGQLAWDAQAALGMAMVPAPSDLLFFSTIVPAVWVLDQALRAHRSRRALLGIYLDAGLVLLAAATVAALLFGHAVATPDAVATIILFGMPVTFLSVAGAGFIVAIATHAEVRPVGTFALLMGIALLGAGYVPWVAEAPAVPVPGSWSNLLFSAGALAIGVAGATFRIATPVRLDARDLRSRLLDALPALAVAVALACLFAAANLADPPPFARPLGWSVIAIAVLRQLLLTTERSVAVREANEAIVEMAQTEDRHRRVIEHIPATVYIDERASRDQYPSQLAFISPQVTRLLGYSPEELRASPDWWYELIHPDDAVRVQAVEDRHFRTGERLDQTFRMRSAAGAWVWVRDEANLMELPGGRLQSHGVLTDVTAQRHAEEQLRSSEEQQRRIIETASSAYVSIDDRGMVIDWNDRAHQTFGWRRDEALGRSLAELIVPPDQRDAHAAGLRRFVATGVGPLVGQRIEVNAVDRDGRKFPVELTIWPVRNGESLTFSALVHDITERRRLEEELRHQAFHDSLTGLANRALFTDRLAHALERRGALAATVLSFDLDDFKLVNDGLGHAAGDELLTQVAGRLTAAIRPGDTAARLGGDEFAVLVEDSDEAATGIAERIVSLFAQPFSLADSRVAAQASVGVAVARPGVNAEMLLREADVAMYEAKRRGKGVWQLFSPSLSRSGIEAIELRADLRQAIDARQLTVAYQPIVDLVTREIVSVEALARWTHPTRGEVPPSMFIPLAESSELILSLGLQILHDACTAVRAWHTVAGGLGDLRLSVNLSARQLLHPTIVADIREVLLRTGLEATALTLEITEAVVVDDAGGSIAAINGLKAIGVHIAIDDFGTGYSSLSYLSRLPVDVLKIDRSFVAELGSSRQSAALVRSIVRIGQTLNLQIVAEGIETEGQLEQLRRIGAGLGQGFLFSQPLDRDAFGMLLEARRAWPRVVPGEPGPGQTARLQ